MFIVDHVRKWYYPQSTVGVINIDGQHFCFTLEDTVRPPNIKVYGETAIPAYTYKVGIRHSPSFARDMVCLYTEKDGYTININGVTFKYVYSHGGNKHKDTLGCVLVGYSREEDKIWGADAEDDLFDIIEEKIYNEQVFWRITNEKQLN